MTKLHPTWTEEALGTMGLGSCRTVLTVVLLLAALALQFKIQPAKASGAIYIRPDGSVSPSSTPISTLDNITYQLTGNINDEVVVQRSNVVVDGNDFTVQGTGGGYGFTLSSVNSIELRNINVKGFVDGIWLSNSFNITIADNNVAENTFTAISLYSSSNNSINGNLIAESTYGIYLSSSSANSMEGNNLTETGISGISLESYSNNNTIVSNMFSNSGLLISSSSGNTVEKNLVNAKPLVFFEGASNFNVTDAGQVILIKCTNVQIKNLDLIHTAVGLELWDITNTEISNSTVQHSYYGIWLQTSSNITVAGNNIENNSVGVELLTSSHNFFIHNNLLNNTQQVHDPAWNDPEIVPSINTWDYGYTSGGNYWSDYNGKDTHMGIGQFGAGSDGIGDAPYLMLGGDRDNYPLMGTFHEFNVSPEYYVQTICNFSVFDFQFNGSAISFNVTGEDGMAGFCRLHVPKALLNGSYEVFVNGTECQYKEFSFSDSTESYLYFTFNGPTENIVIVPEFTTPVLGMLTMIVAMVLKMTRTKRKCKEICTEDKVSP